MPQATASIVINKPIENVFDFGASPRNGPSFIPNLNENSNLNPDTDGAGQTFDWHFNMAGVDLYGKGEVAEWDRPSKSVLKTTGDSVSTWTYQFEDADDGTKVSVTCDYEVADRAMAKMENKLIIEKINQHTAETLVQNLKTILED